MLVQCNVLILHQYLHVYQLQPCTRKTTVFFPGESVRSHFERIPYKARKFNIDIATEKKVVGRLLSYWEGNSSTAMFNLGRGT